ncbi:26S proteasome non-ATPase regulatory subunit 8, partial [Phyllosticta capitalensis]
MNSCYIISRTFERPSCSGETFGFADRDAVGARWTARAVKASAPTVTARHHRRQARREQSTPTQPPATLPSTTAIPSPSSSATATATSPLPTTPTASTPKPAMAEKDLQTITSQLQTALQRDPSSAGPLLSRAKLLLLQANALMPSPTTNPAALAAARGILELGALISIKQQDPDSFTRYFHSLSPFYSLPPSALAPAGSQRSKITGLYLLLLLSQGDYAGFHTVLEGLEVEGEKEGRRLDEDAFVQYPVRLEQALMEGAYDRVWGETKGERVPSEEFSVFSQVLINTIRSEIASCSEKAYPSIPITDAKSLLFLESEGAVVEFAKQRGWACNGRDGRIYFPQQELEQRVSERDVVQMSGTVIENTLGYARELETIV